jgi:hypothetical protein
MAEDVVTPSNPPVVHAKEEQLKKTPLDVNVSQWSHDKKMFERMVRTQIDHLAWGHQLFPNPHVSTMYLKKILTRGVAPEKFEEC